MYQGIYSITNKVTGYRYIGSSRDIVDRMNVHLKSLRKNKHGNTHLQNAFNKYDETMINQNENIWK